MVVLAQEEARTLKHNYVGTEHILLGLVRENEGVAARILLDFDADSEKIRNEVIRMLSMSSRPQDADTMRAHDSEDDLSHTGTASAPALPDLGALPDGALDDLIDELLEQERAISYRRRILHGKIDILRAERQNRGRRGGD
ncbi:MAG TPA: Clp protease N-terminal domain-containing protein [Solirubrobacteraceae bacterium]|nr:Clp protease N-terminal domain-containing protein [Solirubrobacteraceae bacterium]